MTDLVYSRLPETARALDDMYVGITTMKRPKREKIPGTVPHGCEWARTCDDCPFPDCEVETPLGYDTEAAKAKREGAQAKAGKPSTEATRAKALGMRRDGRPEYAVAEELGVDPRTVRRWCMGADGIARDEGRRHRGRPRLSEGRYSGPSCLPDPGTARMDDTGSLQHVG
jgi:hypothetical protein